MIKTMHKVLWLLMVLATLTITSCKGGSTSKTDKEEPVDTASIKQGAHKGYQKPDTTLRSDTVLRTIQEQQPTIANEGLSPVGQMNTFALQLFQQIHKSSEKMQNLVVSPLSVATLLSIITYGAEGETLSEITNALGIKAKDVESILSKLKMKDDKHASLHMANLLATRPDIPLRKDFVNTIAHRYRNTATKTLDLTKEKERQKIDEWCKKQTEGMIPQITDKNDQVTVLLSAICFKALWEESFEDNYSRIVFENADKSKVLLPSMSRLTDMMVEDRARYVALGLNYRGGRYKMLLLLPNEGKSIDDVLNDLTTSELEFLLKSKEDNTETKLEMPKFEMRLKQPLIPILKQMGIRLAFTPQASFGRMSNIPLYIANVEQRAYIEVNQNGTEASAATKASMAIGAMGGEEPSYRYINVNRPFLFVIGDRQTGVALFMGEYRGDEKAKKYPY